MHELLEVTDLRVRYRALGPLLAIARGVRDPFLDAILGVSLSIGEGETLAVVGESGSGKTTLARAILGLLPLASGTVRLKGIATRNERGRVASQLRRQVSYIPQDPIASLSPRMTIQSLLMEPFKIHGVRVASPTQEGSRLLELVQLSGDFLSRYPHELSGGQARRVGIARSIALNPKLVIADEPTAGLDVSIQGGVLNLLLALQKRLGLAVVLITHHLAVARHMSDRVAVMYLGRIVELGDASAVFRNPAHPYSRGLVAAIPSIDPDQRELLHAPRGNA